MEDRFEVRGDAVETGAKPVDLNKVKEITENPKPTEPKETPSTDD
jgi:hypothetical protein